MASTSKSTESDDEHTNLQNELIFLSKLLRQHKQTGKTIYTINNGGQRTHKKHLTHHPPFKKDMVWRRTTTTIQDKDNKIHENVHQRLPSSTKKEHSVRYDQVNLVTSSFHQSLPGKSKNVRIYDKTNSVTSTTPSFHHLLPSKSDHLRKYAKVQAFTKKPTSTTSSQLLPVKSDNFRKYSKVNSVTSPSTSSPRLSAKSEHCGKYTKVNSVTKVKTVQLTSLPAKSKHLGKYAKVNSTTQIPAVSSTSNKLSPRSNHLEKYLKVNTLPSTRWSDASNKTSKSREIKNDCCSLENTASTSIIYSPEEVKLNNYTKNYSPIKNVNMTDSHGVPVKLVKKTDPNMSPKKSPNSKYVWRKEEKINYGIKEVIPSTKKPSRTNQFVPVSTGIHKNINRRDNISLKLPKKCFNSPQRRNVVRTKYKLHLESPKSTVWKELKVRKDMYSNSDVYLSPKLKRKRSLTRNNTKKMSKSNNSQHRWVHGPKERAMIHAIKRKSKSPHDAGTAYKSKFTWRKEQLKTKQVSECGYKLVNVSRTFKTPHRFQSTFMERRKKYINSHTPVLPRSRFKLRKKQLTTLSAESTKTPLRRTINNVPSALFTVSKTKRKIVRKPAVKMSPTSVISESLSGKKGDIIAVSNKSQDFKVHSSGKKLKRLRTTLNTSISPIYKTTRTVIVSKQFISSRKLVAQQVLHRSIITSNQAKYKKHNKKTDAKRYCTYYNRFGKCSRGDKCQYIHDPEKVAVCTRFLRGKCKQTDGTCPFSHKISKDKMPVCSYFLRGICNRDSCSYLHVNVSRNAAICQDFLRGYCPAGDECKKKHSLECPDYQRDGNCPRGRLCRLLHRQQKSTKRKAEQTEHRSTKKKLVSFQEDIAATSFCQNKEQDESDSVSKLPSFISLNDQEDWFNTPNTSMQSVEDSATPELLIRPKFTNK